MLTDCVLLQPLRLYSSVVSHHRLVGWCLAGIRPIKGWARDASVKQHYQSLDMMLCD